MIAWEASDSRACLPVRSYEAFKRGLFCCHRPWWKSEEGEDRKRIVTWLPKEFCFEYERLI